MPVPLSRLARPYVCNIPLLRAFHDPAGGGRVRHHCPQSGLRRPVVILAFVTSAVLWLLLEAEFLAIVLVLVYVGAVMVLFLFVVMMLDVNVAP